MKVLKTNDIKIENLNNIDYLKTTAKNAIVEMVKVEEKHVQYVNLERDDGDLLKASMHPFVKAAHLAYSDHLPLVISPDMIWYLISSATAVHINKNAEELRSKFVNHQGKKTIKLRRDDFRLGQPNPWHELIDDFAGQIAENTNNNISDILVSNFSTTTKNSRVVSQIVLMDAMQKYFDYSFSTMCGIPEIRVTGTKEDWQNVKNKTQKLFEIIPKFEVWGKAGLNEILDNFINVFDDKIDAKFWNSIYKIGGGSGGPYISGWIIALFPYLKDEQENHYVWSEKWSDIDAESFFGGLTTSSFDYHLNQVPVTWEYFGEEIKLLFVGGLLGVLYAKDKSLTPVFGYGITEDQIKKKEPNQFNLI